MRMAEPRGLDGRWSVAVTTNPGIANGSEVALVAREDGLEVVAGDGPGQVSPWGAVDAAVDPLNGLVILELGRGRSLALWPGEGADPRQQLEAIHTGRETESAVGRRRSLYQELPAGPDRILVVYPSGDTGDELDADVIYAAVAEDARVRAEGGWTLVSLVALPLRHAGVKLWGTEGSGYATKAALGGLYARS
jgi:hypothetical protein